ncbi:class I adenylate-forming enzyme family protein [Anaerosporomusa subterranea]|uniref:class I adenylate-forming enzyme family protein n=1 Tax=Anaerosporomusa subterranea TaxID=1794912 RepID=UPI000ADB36D6|nr:AMP-binding protein [Anaerosporomusa subterranea]
MKGAENVLIHHVIQDKSEDDQTKKNCLIYGNTRLTYSELNRQTDCLAHRLAVQIKKGDKILVKLSDPVAQLLYFFAVIKAGGACVLIDASTSEEVTAELIKRHKLNLYINENFEPPIGKAPILPDLHPQDVFFGALSSGSTGIPKLIWRDHQSWTSAFAAQSQAFNIDKTDTIYLVGSLVYTANLNSCLHIFAEGGAVVIAGNSMPRTWAREIADFQVSAIFMVPVNYRRLLKAMETPVVQIKSIISCGAKLDRNTVQDLLQYFPQSGIYEYYGASELGHVSYLTADESVNYPGAVGRAFPGVTISIEDGTIWVESPYLAPQYRPKASVGDLGRIDAAGYLYLLGRKHGLINTGGVKVIPEQVEDILLQCPGVAEAVVSGVEDPIRGQKVCAWLVKSKASLKSCDVLAFCRRKMLKHCCPQKIIFVDAMPLTANGKIDKIRLRREI